MMRLLNWLSVWVLLLGNGFAQSLQTAPQLREGDFPIVSNGSAASIVVETADPEVCQIAAACLAEDIERVSGIRPPVVHTLAGLTGPVILIGTLESPLLQKLSESGKIHVNSLRGQWETALIEIVEQPFPGIQQGLIIAGSDRRGAAYGVFELSEAMGISPWVWWADVTAEPHQTIAVRTKRCQIGPPSVRYRGIFLNDEDWGLQPWAAKTFEKDPPDIGPKTYAKIFELLLRLKANLCWPAMHDCTKAFNHYPENKRTADRYAIVMGSSHCEPLLRNNVDEWDSQTRGPWNYKTNRQRMMEYWSERVRENAAFENIYTIGLRGVHDSGMVGVRTMEEKVALLQQAIADQRAILAQYVCRDLTKVPQSFCPYKEVLEIYENGLKLPEDVTIVWVDDNHGYIRRLSDPQEQKRPGRSGVYYHFSYWGSPADYLWLGSTPPAVVCYEMHKAYAYGADRIWVFNVGDIKPIEKEMTLALEMAWDISRWTPWNAHTFCSDWAGRTFGAEFAEPIGRILNTYYRLAADARPEHLLHVSFTETEMNDRLAAYQEIAEQAEALKSKIPERLQDAYFQLVSYPVLCAGKLNEKIFYDILSEKAAQQKSPKSAEYAAKAQQAYEDIQELTRFYNEELSGGKWRYMMYANPNNRRVFWEPQRIVSAPIELDWEGAEIHAPLVLQDGCLVSSSPTLCTEQTGGSAVLEFEAPEEVRTSLWFYARTPSDKEDSWFVSLHDWSGIVNNQVTGSDWAWLKAAEIRLRKGTNRLTIRQREPNARIRRIAFADRRPALPDDPVRELAAAAYQRRKDHPALPLAVIPGYQDGGVTVRNLTAAPLAEEQIQEASWVEYETELEAGDYRLCVRCMPTHRIHKGRGVRIGIAAGGREPVLKDLHASEWSAAWSENVVRGYSETEMDLHQETAGKAVIRIYLPEPGVVLQRLVLFRK